MVDNAQFVQMTTNDLERLKFCLDSNGNVAVRYVPGVSSWGTPVEALTNLPGTGTSLGEARVVYNDPSYGSIIAIWNGTVWVNLGSGGGGGVPTTRTITINGTTYDLSVNRTWTVGDMLKSTYDPTNKVADAFSMDNMVEGSNTKILTSAERTKLTNTTNTNSGDNATNSQYSGLVSNATHTGDVTGATALTINKTAITGKTAVTAETGVDYVLISDTSDGGNLKKALLPAGGGGSGDMLKATYDPTNKNQDIFAYADGKQDELVSGTNIKTVNSTSLLGSGNIEVTGGLSWITKTTTYTANVGEGILADTSLGVWTLTLPMSPAVGDEVGVSDSTSSFSTNNLTIARNSSKIHGLTEDLVVNIKDASFKLVYTGGSTGWKLDTYLEFGTDVILPTYSGFDSISDCIYDGKGLLNSFISNSTLYSLTYNDNMSIDTVSDGTSIWQLFYNNRGGLLSIIKS